MDIIHPSFCTPTTHRRQDLGWPLTGIIRKEKNVATLHQVILRRTGVYILPGEPANRWIIETPTITEGLRHRVRRILGPRIEELTELGVAIAQDSRAVLATMSYTEFDEFTADWKHLRGARGGRAFRRDFDMRQPHLSDRQRYTEQILHYITRSITTCD